jgi:hypothetical protein
MSKPGLPPGLLERREVKKKNYIASLVYHVLTKKFKQIFHPENADGNFDGNPKGFV